MSEVLLHRMITEGLVVISRDTFENFKILKQIIEVLSDDEEKLEGWDRDALLKAATSCIDIMEQIIAAARPLSPGYDSEYREAGEYMVQMRKELAECARGD